MVVTLSELSRSDPNQNETPSSATRKMLLLCDHGRLDYKHEAKSRQASRTRFFLSFVLSVGPVVWVWVVELRHLHVQKIKQTVPRYVQHACMSILQRIPWKNDGREVANDTTRRKSYSNLVKSVLERQLLSRAMMEGRETVVANPEVMSIP